MQSLPLYRKWMLYIVIIFLTLSIVTPVLADYLGPNRTVTETVSICKVILYECKYVPAKGDYRYHQVDNWSCSNESKPWKAYPSNSSSCDSGNVGYQYWSQDTTLQETTITYPPATISNSLQNCTFQNGWCVTPPELSLSGNEPVSGYNILAIEGTLNGQTFACSTASCDVPLSEGDNNFTYWALSSWGDSSTMGSYSAKVDSVSPDVSLSVSGASGINGWYVSPTTLTAIGSDATSGLASALLSADGGPWQPSSTLNEGVHAVAVTASDNAGNTSNSSTTISVDTTTPAINMSVNGTAGKDGWYRSIIQVSAIASDATSGVGIFEVSADGGTYQGYSTLVSFSEGQHTVQFKAADNAGNLTETPLQTFYVDTIPPVIELPASWQLGKNVPYSVKDSGSGLASLRLVIEDEDERYAKVAWNERVSGAAYSQDIDWNGQFKDKTVAPPGTYLVWVKASDIAGNESIKLGKIVVPESNVFTGLLQPNDPSDSEENLLPPEDLSESSDSSTITTPPNLDFGGSKTETTEPSTQSVFLTTGTAASIPTSSPNVLWGAAATAMIGAATAYALEERRKREEAIANQFAQEMQEEERREKKKARKMEKLEAQWAQEQAWEEARRLEEARENDIPNIENKIARLEYEQAVSSWVAQLTHRQQIQENKKAAEEKKKQEEAVQAGLTGHHLVTRSEERESPSAEPNWWEKTKSFLVEKIVQPVITTVNENIYKPYIQPYVTPKKVATTLLATAIGAVGLQWVNNVVDDPNIFPSVQAHTEVLIEELHTKHPFVPENHTLSYVVNHPYDVIATGADYLSTLTTIGASYADAVWQQNPLVQAQTKSFETLENSVCSHITGQSWSNRCSATFYLAAGLTATPFDTALGIGSSFVVDPVAGFVKQAGLAVENLEALPNFMNAIRQGGLQGAGNFMKERLQKIRETWATDKQMQSTIFFAGLLLTGLLAAPVAAGAILGMTAKNLVDLDSEVTKSRNKKTLVDLITSHNVRTTVVGSILALAMITAGLGKQVWEFRSFQESLSPTAQTSFAELPLIEQTRLASLAIEMKVPPEALDFYLAESARSGSPLSGLSMTDALQVSSLAEQSGQGAFLLDYIDNYGMTDALRIATPDVLRGMVTDNFLVRAQNMFDQNAGYNISPEEWFTDFSSIGRKGTFITDDIAIKDIVGEFNEGTMQVSTTQVAALEQAFGLERGSLQNGFRITKIIDIRNMNLSYPVEGNSYFLGPGQGLPGGAPEVVVSPSIKMNSPYIIQQTIVEVIP